MYLHGSWQTPGSKHHANGKDHSFSKASITSVFQKYTYPTGYSGEARPTQLSASGLAAPD